MKTAPEEDSAAQPGEEPPVAANEAVMAPSHGDRPAERDFAGSLIARRSALFAWAAVLGTVAWSLWELRATLLPISYLDDASVHEQMVRFATATLQAGHNPLTSWFPYLQEGSPQFLHYQSLPAILTGLVGMAIGPDTAFRWSFYLLWCLWPIAIYGSARLMRLGRYEASVAAVISPLLASVPGVGYEQKGYIWIGYGVWTQLFAMWTLPFAWATTFRAMEDRRFLAPATIFIGLTAALHFETGYLAIIPIAVLPFIKPADLWARLKRAALLLVTSGVAVAWVVVPLLVYSKYAAINQPLQQGPLVNGYGARTILGWLFSGQGFDSGRFPSVTLLVAAGIVAAGIAWQRRPEIRAIFVLLGLGLVLAFGRTTWGPLVDIIPGSHDVFFRRFYMAVQLAGIYLAGIGAVAAARLGMRGLERLRTVGAGGAAGMVGGAGIVAGAGVGVGVPTGPGASGRSQGRATSFVPFGLVAVLGFALLLPAWVSLHSYDSLNSFDINYQRGAEAAQAPNLNPILDYIRAHGNGRTYAGSPSDYGTDFDVGYVEMYKYLENEDIDEVGYTLRTAALMDVAEFYFDDANLGDYSLFGIRYVIVPTTTRPPRGATFVMQHGIFRLYELADDSYFRVVDTIGSIAENRADIGAQSRPYLDSRQPGEDVDYTVAYADAAAAAPTSPGSSPPGGVPGKVLIEDADLASGYASATVDMSRRAVVVLSASYDPGWQVTVDGKPAQTEMLEPALVGVVVGAGRHTVTFRYVGFSWYPELIVLALVEIAVVAVFTLWLGQGFWRRRAASSSSTTSSSEV
jgi:hypothetical protein